MHYVPERRQLKQAVKTGLKLKKTQKIVIQSEPAELGFPMMCRLLYFIRIFTGGKQYAIFINGCLATSGDTVGERIKMELMTSF